MIITTTNHDRNKAGLTYVYPVLSRRAGGLSIGINLNINNACNWQCIYCQVPDLIRGSAPPVNFDKLGNELRYFLTDVIQGDFYDRESVPDEQRVIRDIAISGNGEPTTAQAFDHVVDVIETVLGEFGLVGDINVVLITNGSMINKETVQAGLTKISRLEGEVWFKVDSVTPAGISQINHTRGSITSTLKRLAISCKLCSTWIQTCVFALENNPPSDREIKAYMNLLDAIKSRQIPINGILLYSIARPSMQPDANKLSRLSEKWLQDFAVRMNPYEFEIRISP